MKITIVCDNETRKGELRAGWGFSAFIESEKTQTILFDTGADSPTLLHNMKELGIDPKNSGNRLCSPGDEGHIRRYLKVWQTMESLAVSTDFTTSGLLMAYS